MGRELSHVLRTYILEFRYLLKVEIGYFYNLLLFSLYIWIFIQLFMCI